jgi:hypothetical protein
LTVVVSVIDAVVGDVVAAVDESEGDSEDAWDEAPVSVTASVEVGTEEVSLPELITDGEDPVVDAEETDEVAALEEDDVGLLAEGAAPPVTLSLSAPQPHVPSQWYPQFTSKSEEVDIEIRIGRVLLCIPSILIRHLEGVLPIG